MIRVLAIKCLCSFVMLRHMLQSSNVMFLLWLLIRSACLDFRQLQAFKLCNAL